MLCSTQRVAARSPPPEELFAWLVPHLHPARIVLAGTVDGVFSRDPLADPYAEQWPEITPATLPGLRASLGGSHGVDVTGGMLSKVTEMVQLVTAYPGLEVRIVSGLRHGAVQAALLGWDTTGGTIIRRFACCRNAVDPFVTVRRPLAYSKGYPGQMNKLVISLPNSPDAAILWVAQSAGGCSGRGKLCRYSILSDSY